MIKPGFFMLEFLIYFTLAALVTLLTLNWVLTTHLQIARCIRKTATANMLSTGHDVLVRELRSAPVQASAWKVITPNATVWSSGNHDVGWYVQDTTLKRYEGNYNCRNQKWHKSTMSVIAENVADCIIIPLYSDANKSIIRSVMCTLNSDDASYQRKYEISLINGMIL